MLYELTAYSRIRNGFISQAKGHKVWVRSPSRSVRLCNPNILLVRKSNGRKVKTTFDHRGLKICISECPIFASVQSGPY